MYLENCEKTLARNIKYVLLTCIEDKYVYYPNTFLPASWYINNVRHDITHTQHVTRLKPFFLNAKTDPVLMRHRL